MTPAERARQIDKKEFAAECAAIRQRAYSRFNMKPQLEQRVVEWIERAEPKRSFPPKLSQAKALQAMEKSKHTRAANAKLYTAFGHTRSLTEWAAEIRMSRNTVRNRLNIGWSLEEALTRPVQEHKTKETAL